MSFGVKINIHKITSKKNYDNPQLHCFVAIETKDKKNYLKSRNDFNRNYVVLNTQEVINSSHEVFMEIDIEEPLENIKSATLVMTLFVLIQNNDHIKTPELEGIGMFDLKDASEDINLFSPLVMLGEEYSDTAHCGVSLNVSRQWLNHPENVNLVPSEVVKGVMTGSLRSEGRLETLHNLYMDGYPSNIGSLDNAYNDIFMETYFLNGFAAPGPLFFQDIENPLITDEFIEHLATVTLLVRGPYESFEDYANSKEFREHPTLFMQTLLTLYANTTCYSEDTAIDAHPRVNLEGSYGKDEKVLYDSFDLLTITGSGDCEDKGRFMLDFFYAVQRYAAKSFKTKPSSLRPLQTLLGFVSKYSMFAALIGYYKTTGMSAHLTTLCMRNDLITEAGTTSSNKTKKIFDATKSKDDKFPSVLLLDTIRPSLNICTNSELALNPKRIRINKGLDKWHPTQLDTDTYSGTVIPTAVMTMKEMDFRDTVVIRLFANHRYNEHGVIMASVQTSENFYGWHMSETSDFPVQLLCTTVYEKETFWREQYELLEFRHPPVQLEPPEVSPEGLMLESIKKKGKGRVEFTVLLDTGYSEEQLKEFFCLPVFIQKKRVEADKEDKDLLQYILNNFKSDVVRVDSFRLSIENRLDVVYLFRVFF